MKGTRALEGLLKRRRPTAGRWGAFPALASALAVCGLFLAALPSAAGDDAVASITPRVPPRELARRAGSIQVDVNLVLIPVLVTDPYERPMLGLQKSDFHLSEDGVEQEISRFFSEDTPISVGIVFDSSASMRSKMEQSVQAVREFLRMSLPNDEFFLTTFSDRPQSMLDFTTDAKDIEDTLPTIFPGGWTALYDAIYLGIHQMKHASYDRKVLFILSDGGDNNSRYTEREIKELVKESDIRIFAISILDRSPALEALAQESGGRAYRVRKIQELPDLASKISEELHSEYVLGFSPADPTKDSRYRKVKVDLADPAAGPSRFHVSWKHGYYGPAQ